MRHILFSTLFTLSTFSAVFYTACSKKKIVADPCASVVCHNNGTCSNGACTCTTPYEGTFCDSVIGNKFMGNWTGSLTCLSSNTNADAITITAGANDGQVIIKNVAGFQHDLTGNITNSTRISIPSQSISADTSFAGTITLLSDSLLKVEYTVEGLQHDACHGTYGRQ